MNVSNNGRAEAQIRTPNIERWSLAIQLRANGVLVSADTAQGESK